MMLLLPTVIRLWFGVEYRLDLLERLPLGLGRDGVHPEGASGAACREEPEGRVNARGRVERLEAQADDKREYGADDDTRCDCRALDVRREDLAEDDVGYRADAQGDHYLVADERGYREPGDGRDVRLQAVLQEEEQSNEEEGQRR